MDKSGKQQAQALLGEMLTRSSISPSGEPPSDEELALLVEGRLSRARREQIYSHLLNDPQRYQQWLDLTEMQEEEPAPGLMRSLEDVLYDWFEHWQFAAATASALAAMVVLAVYIGMEPPEREQAAMVSDSAGIKPLSAPSAPMDAEPVAERRALAKREAAPAPAESLMAAKPQMADRVAEQEAADVAAQPCQALIHPQAGVDGWLCLSEQQDWRWQSDDAEYAGLSRRLDNLEDSGRKLNPKLSAGHNWLAYISEQQGKFSLRIVSVPGLFGENIRVYHFDADGLGLDYDWDDNQLLIYSSQALVPTQAGAPTSPQRFDPDSGRFVTPPDQ